MQHFLNHGNEYPPKDSLKMVPWDALLKLKAVSELTTADRFVGEQNLKFNF